MQHAQEPRDLWLGIVPAWLARDRARFRANLDTLAWLSAADPGSALAARVAAVHRQPHAPAAAGLAEAVATRDGVPAGQAAVSHLGLGWLAIAAAQGDVPAAELLTAAHLRFLRGWRAARGGPDDEALLWTIERGAKGTEMARAVRGFARAARAGRADDAALETLIAEIDPGGGLDHFLAADPRPVAAPAAAGNGPAGRAPAGERPTYPAMARHLLRCRAPWLQPAIDALCPADLDPAGPVPPIPVVLAGPEDRGRRDLVQALAALLDVGCAARAAPNLPPPDRSVRAAADAAARHGSGAVMLRLDDVDALDAAHAGRLAAALRAEGFLPARTDAARAGGRRGLVMLAERVDAVPDELRRDARLVETPAPGPADAAHLAERVGTAAAIARGLAAAWELPLGDRTWADLRARIAGGAGPAEIRARIESI